MQHYRAFRRRQISITALAMTLAFAAASAARAEIPSRLEPVYAEAVLAFNEQNFSRAITLLDDLLKQAPTMIEAMELKALVLKSKKDDPGAEEAYRKLLEQKKKDKRPISELLPYYFELGVIKFNAKKFEEAEKFLEFTSKNGFNESPSNFYLGMIHLQQKRWNVAEDDLLKVVQGGVEELKPAAHLYLGQVYFNSDYPPAGVQNIVAAKTTALSITDRTDAPEVSKQIAKQIYDAAAKAMEPFDKGTFFASLGTMTGYDSNLLAVPTSVASSSEVSGKSSIKQTFLAGIGYATSPLKTYQFVPSYRGMMNYNFNRDAKSTEYASNTLSVYINRNAMARTTVGTKLEGALMFKNSASVASDPSKFKSYTSSFTLGPYVRHELRPRYVLTAEFGIKFIKYEQDPTSVDLKRSGMSYTGRVGLDHPRGTKYINPQVGGKFTYDDTRGTEYRALSTGFDLSNAMKPNEKMTVTPSIEYAHVSYSKRPSGKRLDDTWTFSANGNYRLHPHWTGLVSASYVDNSSNVPDLYTYTQFVFNVGASYSF